MLTPPREEIERDTAAVGAQGRSDGKFLLSGVAGWTSSFYCLIRCLYSPIRGGDDVGRSKERGDQREKQGCLCKEEK